ncbi:hypothetical protein SLA2020_396650 [Shorea laevis]
MKGSMIKSSGIRLRYPMKRQTVLKISGQPESVASSLIPIRSNTAKMRMTMKNAMKWSLCVSKGGWFADWNLICKKVTKMASVLTTLPTFW